MTDEMRMTTLNTSVGADDGRSLTKCTGDSITDEAEEIKSFEEWQRELLRLSDPSYLKTVSMTELFDNVYQSRPPIIDGLLCRGMYLFVGAPKMGIPRAARHGALPCPGRRLWTPARASIPDVRNGGE